MPVCGSRPSIMCIDVRIIIFSPFARSLYNGLWMGKKDNERHSNIRTFYVARVMVLSVRRSTVDIENGVLGFSCSL